jgi:hypothetical protein
MEKDSLQDEMDKISIEQLHKAVLQLSSNCFELKKLCVTILVSASVLIATFTQKRLDSSFFIGGAVIIFAFWILDSQSYYYQEKLRDTMKEMANGILQRHQQKIVVEGVGMPLSKERSDESRLRRSLFNNSMLFYLILFLFDLGLAASFSLELIHTPAK